MRSLLAFAPQRVVTLAHFARVRARVLLRLPFPQRFSSPHTHTPAMRFGLSSSSEASGDEGLQPLTDLRTRAGRAGPRSKLIAPPPPPPVFSSSADNLDASPSQQRAFTASLQRSTLSPQTQKHKKKIVPPWIKSRRTEQAHSSEDDDDDDDDSRRAGPSRHTARRNTDDRLLRARSTSLGISGAISDSSASALSSDEEDTGAVTTSSSDFDTSDSEEIDWPVAPGRRGRQSGRRKTRGTDRAAIKSVKLAADEKIWGDEWIDAPTTGWRSRIVRHSTQLSSPSIQPASTSASTALDDDFDQVQSLLTSLRIEKEEAERKDRQEFEQREKKLWASIEDAIRKAEEDARKQQQEEADRLAAARKAQEEAEKKAKEAKAAEEKRIKEEQEAREKAQRQAEEQKKQDAAAEQKRLEEEQARERLKGMGGGDALRAQARVDYAKWADKMRHIKENVLPVVSSNATWRKQCFQAKRQITPKIGQLTNTQEEIWRITSLISTLLNEAKAAPAPNQEIYLWVLNHLSKCLIRQAEQEVSVKIDTAYPLARLVLWLILQGHKELGDVLMARLVKKCCWCLGYVPERKTDQDDAAFAKTIGRASPEESSVQFTSRISGIIAFYFAICQTSPISPPPPSPSTVDISLIPPHFRTSALWTWSARCITPPMTSHAVVPALWATCIEVAGDTILACYCRQAVKIWKLLYEEGILNAKADFVKLEEGKAASGRLQLLLEDVIRTGKVEVPKGRQMRV